MRILNQAGGDFLIAHFQGGSATGLHPVIEAYSARQFKLPPDITLITVCNNPDRSMLIAQLAHNGISYTNDAVIGAPWNNTKKIGHVTTALARTQTRYALILDAADVLFANDPANIRPRFETYGKKLLFGATKANHPKQLIDKIRDRDFRGDFRYLNAGTAFGYTEDAWKFYSAAREIHESGRVHNPDNSEQLIVRHQFADSTDWVDFDWKCVLFQTFGGTEVMSVSGGDVYQVR